MINRKIMVVISFVIGVVLVASVAVTAGCAPTPEEVIPIKVGVPEKITGPYASDGEITTQSITMAVEEINAAGGLLGRPLEIVLFDIEDMTAEKIIAAAEYLIVKEKVDVLVSGYAGMGPDYEHFGKYTVPYFNYDSVTSCTDMVMEDPDKFNLFHIGTTDRDFGAATFNDFLQFPYGFPNNKIALIAADWEWEISYTMLGTKPAAEEMGWEVVMEEIFPYATTEWGPIMSKVRATEPAIIHLESLWMDDPVNFFREFMKDPTDTLIFFGYAVAMPGFPELVGEEGEGILGMGVGAPASSEEGRAWIKRFNARWGREAAFSVGVAVNTYDAVMQWAAAVEAVGDPTDHRAICKYLEDYPYHGIAGIYDYGPRELRGHRMREGPDFPMAFMQIQDGKVVDIMWSSTPVPGAEYQLQPWLEQYR